MSDLYWLTDEQMERLRPFFPKSHGKARVDDRRVLSGIVFVNCLIPGFDGAILSLEWKEAIWGRYVTGAPRPRTPSEQQYSDRKLRSRH